MDKRKLRKFIYEQVKDALITEAYSEPSSQILSELRKVIKLNTGISIPAEIKLYKIVNQDTGIYQIELTTKVSGAVAMNLIKTVKLMITCSPLGIGGYVFECDLIYTQPKGGVDSYDLGTAFFENGQFHWK
jgi:hypothetical protein